MKGKRLRLPFEHVATYAHGCQMFAYGLLSLVDADVAAHRRSPVQARLEMLLPRLEAVRDELWAIRGELVELRYDPDVRGRMAPQVAESLGELEKLGQAIYVLECRAALCMRGYGVREGLRDMPVDAVAADACTKTAVKSVQVAVDKACERLQAPSSDLLVALEALHDGTSFDEALERERSRWR